MPIYAIFENGLVVNAIVTDQDDANKKGLVELTNGAGIGWSVANGTFIAPALAEVPISVTENSVRMDRNALLSNTDWTQLADVPQAVKDSYVSYRQALRDVPQQAGFPNQVVWPESP